MIKFLQVNVNHSWGAQDLMAQHMEEWNIGIGIISEPVHVPQSPLWYGDRSGVAAIVWCPHHVPFPCVPLFRGNGCVAIGCGDLVIASCYVSPNSTIREYQTFIDELMVCVDEYRGMNLIIAGDFNAKSVMWNSPRTNTRGVLLERWSQSGELRLLNDGFLPTCVRHQGSSIIDLTWVSPSLVNQIIDWSVLEDEESLSDHRYIRYSLAQTRGPTDWRSDKEIESLPRWIMKDMNKDTFETILLTGLWIMDNPNSSVDELAMNLKMAMTNAVDAVARRVKGPRRTNKYWWNDKIATLRKEAIVCRRKITRLNRRRNIDHSNVLTAVEEYREARKALKDEIRRAKTSAWKELIATLEQDPWGMPYRIVLNRLHRASPSATESMSFSSLNAILDDLFPSIHQEKKRELDNDDIIREEDTKISTDLVRSALKGKKTCSTAPGPDGLSRKIWCAVPDAVIDQIKALFIKCIKDGKFPTIWKEAILVLIPKAEQPDEPPKYRPICLINDIAKAFERILASRIRTVLEESRCACLSRWQFGFRPGLSTVDAILEVRNFIEEAFLDREYVLAVSLDVKNAFNSILWNKIIDALIRKKFPNYLIRLIQDYFSNRSVLFKGCDGRIHSRKVRAGVPQGSVLGPLLWNIAYDSVLGTPVLPGCRVVCYADDLLLLTRAPDTTSVVHRSNICAAMILHKTEQLGLSVATRKTEAVLFRNQRKRISPIEIRIGYDFITVSNEMKYLGVILDYRLTFRSHFNYMEKKAYKVMRSLWKVLPNLRGPGEDKRRLYSQVIHSVLLYAAPVWCDAFLSVKYQQLPFKRLQRGIAARTICAYRTVSFEAASLLARIPPFPLLVARQKRLYERYKEARRYGELTREIRCELKEMADVLVRRNWKVFMENPNRPGRRVAGAILPMFEKWVNRSHGSLSYYITQWLTGHGSFESFLYRIGKRTRATCPFCYAEEDTADHTFQRCPKWQEERFAITQEIGSQELDTRSIMITMLGSRNKWKAVVKFATTVLTRKEVAERNRKNNTEAVILIQGDPE